MLRGQDVVRGKARAAMHAVVIRLEQSGQALQPPALFFLSGICLSP